MTRPKRKPSTPRSLEISLPATSANLGPAFDAAALAFDLWLKISARTASDFSITAIGRDPEVCGKVRDHLILDTYRDVLRSSARPAVPLALRLDNQIPIGKGCGSSAAARLAGIALAVHFGKLGWKDDRIVGEASRLEHHPDNASACWFGGLAVARMLQNGDAQVARIPLKGKWPLLLALPMETLSTEQARRALPDHYSRADVVVNIQNSMLLLAALGQGRRDLLADSLNDRIHEPYRAHLCPLLTPLQKLAGSPGILGAVLSGAGPSVLIFLDSRQAFSKAKAQVVAALRQHGLAAELISTAIAKKGTRQTHC